MFSQKGNQLFLSHLAPEQTENIADLSNPFQHYALHLTIKSQKTNKHEIRITKLIKRKKKIEAIEMLWKWGNASL